MPFRNNITTVDAIIHINVVAEIHTHTPHTCTH